MSRSGAIHRRDRQPGEMRAARAAVRMKCLECCCWLWPYRMGARQLPEKLIAGENGPATRANSGVIGQEVQNP